MGYLDKQPSCRPITYWNWIIPAEVRKQRRRSANNCKGKRIYDSSTDDDVQRPGVLVLETELMSAFGTKRTLAGQVRNVCF